MNIKGVFYLFFLTLTTDIKQTRLSALKKTVYHFNASLFIKVK